MLLLGHSHFRCIETDAHAEASRIASVLPEKLEAEGRHVNSGATAARPSVRPVECEGPPHDQKRCCFSMHLQLCVLLLVSGSIFVLSLFLLNQVNFWL